MSRVTKIIDENIIDLLLDGGIGFMPSDTIYGLSCRAQDQAAVEKLHKIKRRDKTKPFIVLISNINQLHDLGVDTTSLSWAFRYWPGKLTVVCDAPHAPDWLHKGTSNLAIRQPDSKQLVDLIDQVGPIISTSANLAGDQPAQTAAQAQKYFGDELDFYIDQGKIGSQPSTIIKMRLGKIEVIRQGAVKIDHGENNNGV